MLQVFLGGQHCHEGLFPQGCVHSNGSVNPRHARAGLPPTRRLDSQGGPRRDTLLLALTDFTPGHEGHCRRRNQEKPWSVSEPPLRKPQDFLSSTPGGQPATERPGMHTAHAHAAKASPPSYLNLSSAVPCALREKEVRGKHGESTLPSGCRAGCFLATAGLRCPRWAPQLGTSRCSGTPAPLTWAFSVQGHRGSQGPPSLWPLLAPASSPSLILCTVRPTGGPGPARRLLRLPSSGVKQQPGGKGVPKKDLQDPANEAA